MTYLELDALRKNFEVPTYDIYEDAGGRLWLTIVPGDLDSLKSDLVGSSLRAGEVIRVDADVIDVEVVD